MKQPTTCKPLYAAALKEYTGGDPEKVRLFAAGFIHGEAEKIYLGACKAAMFRPKSQPYREITSALTADAAKRYGLLREELSYLDEKEFWLLRPSVLRYFTELKAMEPNSPAWHVRRAALTGVPPMDIDVTFHTRTAE